jgi:hypothetical protein
VALINDKDKPAGFSPACTVWVRFSQKNKNEASLDLALKPSLPNLFWVKDMFGKIYPYNNHIYFISFCFNSRPNEFL